MPETALTIQEDIVRSIVGIMPHPWKRIVLNYEIDDEEEKNSDAYFFHVVQDASGELAKDSDLSLPDEVEDRLFELQDAMSAHNGDRWGICDLVIEEDGRYDFAFDYGRAKRINGVMDESSYDRFKNYLATYEAELASSSGSPAPERA